MIAPCSVNTWLYVLGRHDRLLRREQLDADAAARRCRRAKKAISTDREVHDPDPLVIDGVKPALHALRRVEIILARARDGRSCDV